MSMLVSNVSSDSEDDNGQYVTCTCMCRHKYIHVQCIIIFLAHVLEIFCITLYTVHVDTEDLLSVEDIDGPDDGIMDEPITTLKDNSYKLPEKGKQGDMHELLSKILLKLSLCAPYHYYS